MMDPASGHQLVFVGGLHRSGTTPFTRALGRHPDVSAFTNTGVKEDEGQHLQDVYPAARQFGGAGRFASDPAAHLTELSPLVSRQNAERLIHQWQRHWDQARPVWLEKSPPNLIMMRFLQQLFPSALFVIVVRHPIVVALSTSKWTGMTSLDALVEHWLHAHEICRADAPQISRLRIVRYEHLVEKPDEVLPEVASFVGLSAPIPTESLDSRRSDRYAQHWRRLVNSNVPWRSGNVRRLQRKYADRIRSFGYELDDALTVDALGVEAGVAWANHE